MRFDRRRFLKTAGAGSLALGARLRALSSPSASAWQAGSRPISEIVVVGAGAFGGGVGGKHIFLKTVGGKKKKPPQMGCGPPPPGKKKEGVFFFFLRRGGGGFE